MTDVANNTEATPKKLGGCTGKGFMPGQSGNPLGRPKKRLIDVILTELLEEGDSAEARKIAKALLKKAAKGDSKAAQLIAERTEGKPVQKLEHSGEGGGPIQAKVLVEFVRANSE